MFRHLSLPVPSPEPGSMYKWGSIKKSSTACKIRASWMVDECIIEWLRTRKALKKFGHCRKVRVKDESLWKGGQGMNEAA